MENKNIKKSKGRPAYIPNIKQLKELYKQVADKTITNEEAWRQAGIHKTLWYKLKKEYEKMEVKI